MTVRKNEQVIFGLHFQRLVWQTLFPFSGPCRVTRTKIVSRISDVHKRSDATKPTSTIATSFFPPKTTTRQTKRKQKVKRNIEIVLNLLSSFISYINSSRGRFFQKKMNRYVYFGTQECLFTENFSEKIFHFPEKSEDLPFIMSNINK